MGFVNSFRSTRQQGLGLMSQCFTSPKYWGYFISNRYGCFSDVKEIPKMGHQSQPLKNDWEYGNGKSTMYRRFSKSTKPGSSSKDKMGESEQAKLLVERLTASRLKCDIVPRPSLGSIFDSYRAPVYNSEVGGELQTPGFMRDIL